MSEALGSAGRAALSGWLSGASCSLSTDLKGSVGGWLGMAEGRHTCSIQLFIKSFTFLRQYHTR